MSSRSTAATSSDMSSIALSRLLGEGGGVGLSGGSSMGIWPATLYRFGSTCMQIEIDGDKSPAQGETKARQYE